MAYSAFLVPNILAQGLQSSKDAAGISGNRHFQATVTPDSGHN